MTDGSGNPLADVDVQIKVPGIMTPTPVVETVTDSSGNYAADLDPGAYLIFFRGTDGCNEWFADEPSFQTADLVGVGGGTTTADAILNCGTITGTVTDGTGPIPGMQVEAFSGTQGGFDETDPTDGSYSILVPAGPYKVHFWGCDVWYDGQSDEANATVVNVPPDGSVTASAALDCGSLRGTVTAGGNPLPNISVLIFDVFDIVHSVLTGPDGTYQTPVPSGSYKVQFVDKLNGAYQSEWFDNQASQGPAATVVFAPGIPVIADADLAPV